MVSGVELIARERQRQIDVERYTPKHDDEHTDFSLAMAAACYAAPNLIYVQKNVGSDVHFCDPWPWERAQDKRRINGMLHGNTPFARSRDERLRQLAIAGALIAAEIDRIQRTASASPLNNNVTL